MSFVLSQDPVLAAEPSLFDAPPIPGLTLGREMVTAAEERELIASIDAAELSPFRFHQWRGKRLTATFGWHYDFDSAVLDAAEALPPWLLPVRDRAAQLVALDPGELMQSLLIRYDRGAGIGWHRDRAVFEHVFGVSLGAPAVLRFRRRRKDGGFDRASLPIPPRSIYHLAGEARHIWEHSIAPMEETRWSITFRSLSHRARRETGGGQA
jgi:DNA oxidative demethylase